jgi:hypothetical protein
VTEPAGRKSHSFGQVVLGLMVVTVLVLLVGVPYYLRYVRYERVAAFHLLPDTELAVRLDVEHIMLFEPARKHLIPLLDELLPPLKPQTESRLARLQKRSQLVFARDAREVVVARGPESDQWLVIVGGKFPDGLVPALHDVLAEEGREWAVDGRVLSAPEGFSIGQAEDGVLVAGPTPNRVRAALETSDVQERIGLSMRGAVAVSAKGRSLEQLRERLAAQSPAFARIGRIERVSGELMLASVPQGHVVLRLPAGSEVSSKEKALTEAIQGWAKEQATGPDRAGEADALKAATVSSPATGIVEVSFPWSQAGLEQGSGSLAGWLRSIAPAR